MALQPGQEWGEVVREQLDPVCVETDRELADILASSQHRPVRATGGDLARTLGSHRHRDPDSAWRRVPIDRIEITTEHGQHVAVAHVIMRKSWWTGPVVFISNAEFLGKWDIAPRAHPGDGCVDLLEVSASMSPRARLQAWKRVRTGTHVPHPGLRSRQVEDASWEFERPVTIFVDGQRWTRAHKVSMKVLASSSFLYI
jgi:hypothetical protein